MTWHSGISDINAGRLIAAPTCGARLARGVIDPARRFNSAGPQPVRLGTTPMQDVSRGPL